MKTISSWSSGKDSSFACYKAIMQGFKVSYLLNTVSQEYDRVLFHGIKSELVRVQAQLSQISIVQRKVNKDNYEDEYKNAASKLKEDGVEGIVYGDISLQDSRDWNEKMCKKLGVKPIFPLWGKPKEQILKGFINAGFKAIVTCAQTKVLGKEWVGRRVDEKFIQELQRKNIDLCGENGEYHTFVTACPLFKKEIKILETRKVFRPTPPQDSGSGGLINQTFTVDGHWFLDILRYEVV